MTTTRRHRTERRSGAAVLVGLAGLLVSAVLVGSAVLAALGVSGQGTSGQDPAVGAAAVRLGGVSPPSGGAEALWDGSTAVSTVAPGAAYAWPLGPPVPAVERPFAAPAHPYGPGHRGVDLAGAPGAPVLATAAGVVVFAGLLAGRGVVSVQHPDGLRTTYEPVAATVRAGATVARGDALGVLRPGHTGCAATCLHWGVRRDRTTYVDPLRLLAPPHVRLLPAPDPWPDGPAAGGGPVRPGDAPGRAPPSAARP